MAIRVSGTVVIDNDRNANVGILTGTALNVNPAPITFSPADGASGVAVDTNIVITYNKSITKGSGNITLRDGSASGSVIETIPVSSGSVTLSAAQVTINPSADFSIGKDIYVVIDAGAFDLDSSSLDGSSVLLDTYNFSTGAVSPSSFSPTDGATNQLIGTNIVITFNTDIAKGSGNITLRAGSASGTIRQTIDVTSGAVSVSGTQATINPPSDLEYSEEIYVVVDAGCFTNTDGDSVSQNAVIDTYNFTTSAQFTLGGNHEGGYLICCASNNYWIVAPSNTEVARNWADRTDANTCAQQVSGCSGWFIPSFSQLSNPGYECRAYWDSHSQYASQYFSDTEYPPSSAYTKDMQTGSSGLGSKASQYRVRSFRCVAY